MLGTTNYVSCWENSIGPPIFCIIRGNFLKKIYPFFVSSTIEVDAFTAKIYEIYEKTRKEGLVQVNCPLLRHFLAIHSLS